MMQKINRKKTIKRFFFRLLCIIVTVVFSFLVRKVFAEKKIIDKQVKKNNQIIHDLNNQIELEDDKYDELTDQKNTINSNNNIEKIAREQFGFIKSDEIILKPKN